MRTNRRSVLAMASAGIIGLTAGCQDAITNEGVDVSAEKAIVAEETIDNSIYDQQETDPYEIDEEIEVGAETYNIEISSFVSTYTISIEGIEDFHDDPEATQDAIDDLEDSDIGIFNVISTPSQEVAGQEINPLSFLTDDELIEEIGDEVDEGEVNNLEVEDDYEQTILGEETTITILSGTATAETSDGEEEEYPIQIHIGEVQNEDDIIIIAGIEHEDLDQQDQFEEFMENIEHPA